MTTERTTNEPVHDDIASAMHNAVRARALEQVRQEEARPKTTLRDRLPAISLTVGAVLIIWLLIEFVVNGMMRIMDIWYPGSISGRVPEVTQPLPKNGNGIDQPFMIGVVSESEISAASSSSSSSR